MNRIATFVKGIGKLCGAYLSFNFLNAKMKKIKKRKLFTLNVIISIFVGFLD